MSSLTIGNLIGSGAFGSVYVGTWEGRKAAIKKVHISQGDVHRTEAIQREMEIMQTLVDNHIIQFYGTAFHDDMLLLVMSYAERGSLQNAIDSGRVADWPTKTRIAQEIVRGLAYIHHKGVLHRDLKSLNVLLTRYMEVKLCDFGLATIKTRSASKSTALKGTPRWMAPELFGTKPQYSTKSDMYALAMVMWEMAANCTTPFQDQPDNFAVVVGVRSGEREVLPDETPADYRQWVERCWDQDPDKRPEASEMVVADEDEPDFVGGNRGNLSTVEISLDGSHFTLSPMSGGNAVELGKDNGSPTDPFTATLSIAEEGDVEAQMAIAAMYEEGNGVEQSDSEAFNWYLRAAEQNSAEAEYKVGDFYLHGRGTDLRHDLALYWTMLAAEKGHATAENSLESMSQDYLRFERDYSEVDRRLQESATEGDAAAQYHLGWMWQYGLGIIPNYDVALSWYHKSAEQGYAPAQSSLGYMYRHGLGVDRDYGEALSWYRMSAEQGNAAAQYNLAIMYENAVGVEQDIKEALVWYRVSAEQGHASAQSSLGHMYLYGIGVKRNHDEAASWYRKAAEQGDKQAKKALEILE